MDKENAIEKYFYSEQSLGICTDPEFEFGNTHRKMITCRFCKDLKCHYNGDCSRRTIPDVNLGWRTT